MLPALSGAQPAGYYNSAEGLSGPDLRQALHLITRNHNVIPYSSGSRTDTQDALQVLDQDAANTNNVMLVYARRSEPKSTFGTTTGWNREHLWPNSYGLDSQEPAYSDLHNLRPADANVNSARGNKFFDDSRTADGSFQKPAHPEAPLCSTDANSWEPPDVVKGDIARAMFYMDVRYQSGLVNETNLVLTDRTTTISSAAVRMGLLATLLVWNRNDPVDDAERLRNERVYSLYQTNRNPFVDRPDFVTRLYEVTPPQPLLVLEAVGASLLLRWPAVYTNARIETASNLGASWLTLTNTPTTQGGMLMITSTLTGDRRLFRLRVPGTD